MIKQDILTKWMREIVNKFPLVSFKYYYNRNNNVYYIGVYPQSFVESSEKYCEAENEFSDKISAEYPDEVFLFGPEDTLFNIPDTAHVIKNTNTIDEKIKTIDISTNGFEVDNPVIVDNYNYFMAA